MHFTGSWFCRARSSFYHLLVHLPYSSHGSHRILPHFTEFRQVTWDGISTDRPQLHVQIKLKFTSRSNSISHPDRPQFYLQIDLNFPCKIQIGLNFTSRSTSISRPDQPQFHVQINLNFTSRSTSIFMSRSPSTSRPERPQFHVQIDSPTGI